MSIVINRFIKNINDTPDAPAIYCNDKLYSYVEFGSIVTAIRKLLPISNQQLIGIVTGDNVYTYASILAILSTGAAYVPLNYKNPKDRNSSIVSEAGLTTILTYFFSSSSEVSIHPTARLTSTLRFISFLLKPSN